MLNSRGSAFSNFPAVTKNLLIINLLVWVAQISLPKLGIDLTQMLALLLGCKRFQCCTIIHLYVHA